MLLVTIACRSTRERLVAGPEPGYLSRGPRLLRRARVRSVACAMLAAAACLSVCLASTADSSRGQILARIAAEPLVPEPRRFAVAPTQQNASRSGVLSRMAAAPIWAHQTFVSPQDGDRCMFTPSCSEYAAQALRARGLAGWPMASDRILRCHHGAAGMYPCKDARLLDPFPLLRSPPRSAVGGWASVVPGLGQWLGGDRGDAAYALGTVALLGWGASHYARQGAKGAATAIGGLGVFFYVGNIYGGARALGPSSSSLSAPR